MMVAEADAPHLHQAGMVAAEVVAEHVPVPDAVDHEQIILSDEGHAAPVPRLGVRNTLYRTSPE